MSKTCPNCQHEQLRRRAAPLPKNVKRREIGDTRDRWVCSYCHETFDEDQIKDVDATPKRIDPPLDW